MEKLNSQLEQALADLLAIEKRGGSATNYIFDVLSGTSGSEREYRYMRELVALGYVTGSVNGTSGGCNVEGLTSRAYSYFDDRAAEEKRRKHERRMDRVWSGLFVVLGLVAGIAATAIGQIVLGLV